MPTISSHNPADLSDLVTEVEGADVAAFTAACRTARSGQPVWAAVPAPLRGRAIAQVGRLVEANK